jgi:hypothetical protein
MTAYTLIEYQNNDSNINPVADEKLQYFGLFISETVHIPTYTLYAVTTNKYNCEHPSQY